MIHCFSVKMRRRSEINSHQTIETIRSLLSSPTGRALAVCGNCCVVLDIDPGADVSELDSELIITRLPVPTVFKAHSASRTARIMLHPCTETVARDATTNAAR